MKNNNPLHTMSFFWYDNMFSCTAKRKQPQEENLPMRGLSFCFTGELSSIKRNEAEDRIKTLGAFSKSTVVKGLSFLVSNNPESGSGKNKKASELGIPVIDEEEFLARLTEAEGAVVTKIPVSGGKQGELF